MADTKAATKTTTKAPRANVWSEEERAAMRAGAGERKKRAKLSPEEERAEGEREVRAKIAELPEAEQSLAERLHEVILGAAPNLVPRTYYGMPAYAKDGKTLCFFKPKSKFKERYSTFGFETVAPLDEGVMWPVAFAVVEVTPDVEARITELVRRAAS